MGVARTARAVETKEWRAKALTLRISGKSMRDIATELGKSVGAVHKAIKEQLEAVPVDKVYELRAIEGARHDAEYTRLGLIVDTVLKPKGRTKLVPIAAVEAAIKAINARTNISAHRAKLYGLNAKESIDVNGDLTLTHDAEDELLDRLARLAATAAKGEDSPEPEPAGEAIPQA
jgi:hypothetical protein